MTLATLGICSQLTAAPKEIAAGTKKLSIGLDGKMVVDAAFDYKLVEGKAFCRSFLNKDGSMRYSVWFGDEVQQFAEANGYAKVLKDQKLFSDCKAGVANLTISDVVIPGDDVKVILHNASFSEKVVEAAMSRIASATPSKGSYSVEAAIDGNESQINNLDWEMLAGTAFCREFVNVDGTSSFTIRYDQTTFDYMKQSTKKNILKGKTCQDLPVSKDAAATGVSVEVFLYNSTFNSDIVTAIIESI